MTTLEELEQEKGQAPSSVESRFVEEVEDAGYETEVYHGYAMRISPAVRADDDRQLIEIIRATTMNLGWDTLGEGYIVYPK